MRTLREPLRARARHDARFCGRACKAARRRERRHQVEAIEIGFAILDGSKAEVSRACPGCGKRFVPGHGHRRDAVYDRPACRTAAWRRRHRQRVRETVTPARAGGPADTPAMALTSGNGDASLSAVRKTTGRPDRVGVGMSTTRR